MREILERAAKLRAEGRPFAVATVVRTTGSTPQVVGAKLLADDLGRLVGTLGGGCVEADAVDEAKRVLETGTPSLRDYELTEDLAYDTGLVCGGTMWIAIEHGREALRAAQRDLLDDLLAASRGGAPVALARDALARGTAQVVRLDDAHELLVEPVTSRPTLVQVGAGHVGLAVARMARLLDFHVIVVDARPEFANRQRIPEADEVVCADMIRAIEELPLAWNTFVVVATRGHKMDAHAVRAAVKTPARYVGLVGSKRKTILIERMLREEGVPEDRIRSVHAPIGLDLGGRTPAEIALAILAEIEAERYGGSARPLRLSADIFDRTIARACPRAERRARPRHA